MIKKKNQESNKHKEEKNYFDIFKKLILRHNHLGENSEKRYAMLFNYLKQKENSYNILKLKYDQKQKEKTQEYYDLEFQYLLVNFIENAPSIKTPDDQQKLIDIKAALGKSGARCKEFFRDLSNLISEKKR